MRPIQWIAMTGLLALLLALSGCAWSYGGYYGTDDWGGTRNDPWDWTDDDDDDWWSPSDPPSRDDDPPEDPWDDGGDTWQPPDDDPFDDDDGGSNVPLSS